jgi:glycosyltransferase involved in cell wall biosynthesis
VSKILWHSCAPWSPSGYGMQTAIWTQELVKMGHEVIISSYWGLSGSPTQWNGIPVLPGFGGSYCSVSLGQHARAVSPDLVITLGDVWVLDPNILRELPIAHWLPSDCRPMSLADRAEVEASGAQLIAMSHFGYENFRRAGFNPVYVPHGIDLEIFRPLENRKEIRESMGISPDDFVVGMNAANNDAIRKAHPEQMLAFSKFLKNHPDALLSMHSGVHTEGGQDLEALAENLGISDRVRCVDQYRYNAGMFQPNDLTAWYNSLDIMSACSFGEGFGIPLIEAQACGIPIITTDASSMIELNPLGVSVGGEPFWNGVHKGWWRKPSVTEILRAYEDAYDRKDDVPRDKLREFAGEYSIANVAENYMKPAVNTLLERMLNKA